MSFRKKISVPLIAYICLLPMLLALGIWQLNRAEEKREIIHLQMERELSTPLKLTEALINNRVDDLVYMPVEVSGHFDNVHQFLLDNQVVDGKVGYFVLTPLRLKNQNKAVLVNRGWLPLGKDRTQLPEIQLGEQEVSLHGIVNRFPRPGLVLAGAEIPGKNWPAMVQVVDSKVLATLLGYPLADFQIELNNSLPNGFKREWSHRQTMPPEKHLAYAGQWFLLALLLTLLFIKFGIKKGE